MGKIINKEIPKQLTNREPQVLELLGERLTNKEIAAQLVISPVTVKAHMIRIYQKLPVNDRRKAVENAIALGFFPPTYMEIRNTPLADSPNHHEWFDRDSNSINYHKL